MSARPLIPLLLLTGAALAAAGWAGGGGAWWLVAAAGLAIPGTLSIRSGGRTGFISGLAVLAVVAVGFLAEGDLHRFAGQWSERSDRWESRMQGTLSRELPGLLRSAEAGAERVSRAWREGADVRAPLLPPGLLPASVHAAAVFGPEGDLLAWEGNHQGPFPADVRFGRDRYFYREGALFGYLYVTHPLPDGEGMVVAASLLRADLPPGLDQAAIDFTSRFGQEHGARIRISRADRVEGESVWDLRWAGRVLFSVTLDPLSEADVVERRRGWWQRLVALGLLGAWAGLLSGARRTESGLAVLAGGLVGILLLLPMGQLLGASELFSPAGLLLAFPPGVTMGDLIVLGGVGAFLVGIAPVARIPRLPPAAAAFGATLLGMGVLGLLADGASRELLAGGGWGWIAFQASAAGLLGLLFTAAFLLGRREEGQLRSPLLALGCGTAVLLALAAALWVRAGPEIPTWVGAFWFVPLLTLILALPADRRWVTGALRVCLGIVVAASLTLPWAWSLKVEAQMAQAEERVERLGTRPDPFLEFLLFRAGEESIALAETGRDAVEILYGAWIRSGLAREDVPVWLTVWSPDGLAREELRIGVAGPRPPVPAGLFQRAVQDRQVLLSRHDLADVHYVAAAPLSRGAVVSMVVPPRRALARRAPLGPLFSPARAEPDPLVLIPILPGEAPGPTGEIDWIRTPAGWQGEFYMAYPDESYHAHYKLDLPGHVLVFARGTLLLLLVLGFVFLLWAAGRRVGLEAERTPGRVVPWITSFRGRVTLALFVFFLLPSLAFGTLAYRTLSGAASRTAGTLAEHAVEDAASWYGEVGGAMDILARRTGADLLLYEGGELIGGSLQELVRLGLYEGWLPPPVHRAIRTGEALMTSSPASLGGWDYVVAYRRIERGRVLAAPAPLQAGAMAVHQREVADLLGFTVVLGAALSLLLSLLVGRALASPIQTLRVASERVGGGNMGVHLPEDRIDEFGAVFGAFNRMVDRLGRTRRALVQSSRRTRAIVEDIATGVVALDPAGRVTLANPRAESLLGAPLTRNQPLPGGAGEGDPLTFLSSWIGAYLGDGDREADTELQIGERRLRVRVRRVSRSGPAAGAVVVSLEDVTDELRTERILAWGEMARQVAHEVKNPLTPIKLGVQHVRRAWIDGRPDFEEILERNVEAVLREIDRLDRIASGFSQYGAPALAGSQPLEEVDVARVADEILALYQGGDDRVRFCARGLEELPFAEARSSELKEVLVNLLENARAALPAGGTVTVEGTAIGEAIELRVVDDGVGIPEDMLPRVFDPHFSTTSGGSGLGLAIVRRLVESWGGRVWAESEVGAGTTVTVKMRSRGERSAPENGRG